MRRLFFSLITAALTLAANAVVVDNTAGALGTNVSDHSVTSLVVTGTIDARDFKFIADELVDLTTLDLSQAQIVAYSDSLKPLVGTIFRFPANELPAAVLMGTDLESITLPANLTSLGYSSLAGCKKLTAITLPETLTNIGSYALSSTGITAVTVPAAVTAIGEGAFSHCGALTSASLDIDKVPAYAFLGDTLLSNVTLGKKVETISKGAFGGCEALQALNVDADNVIRTIEAEAFINANAQSIDFTALKQLASIGNWAFSGSKIVNANVPNTVNTLGEGAFYYALDLASASLPEGLAAMPGYTFAGASSLTTGNMLAEGVESIGDYAFYNLNNVSVFTIPASVSYIGAWAMAGMTGLDSINTMPTTAPELGENVWAGVEQKPIILNPVSNEAADLYEAAEQWKEFYILRYYLMGDINGDGYIDIADINCLISYMLEQEVDPFIWEAADGNKDNQIDIADINIVISDMLNDTKEYFRKVKGMNGNRNSDCLSMEDFSITPGTTRTVELNLDNSSEYSGFQFDIELPEGLSIVPGSLRSASRSKSHTFMMNETSNRIIGFSMANKEFTGNDGAVLAFDVTASSELQNESVVGIGNVVFTTRDCHSIAGTGCMAQINTTTGVNDMHNTTDKVYAHGNTLVIETADGGVAQIVAMNGMAQEINVEAGHSEVSMSTGFYVVRLNGNSYKVAIK